MGKGINAKLNMFEQLIVTVSDCVPRKENIDVVLL